MRRAGRVEVRMNSLIIPVYRNEDSISDLLDALAALNNRQQTELEVVFVVDGSPDQSHARLSEALDQMPFGSQLIALSRNFGSFAAIHAGLAAANGANFAVMAADLQEPPELMDEFFRLLESDSADVVIGTRDARADSLHSQLTAASFWWLYRKLINPQIPPGGVDVFACNRKFRDRLLLLDESHSSLIGLLFWLGFRRKAVSYERLPRRHGKSAWTLPRKLKYMLDSVFAFSDLPIRLLLGCGVFGIASAVLFGLLILTLRFAGNVAVPGYAATMTAILFFGGLNAFGLGIVGSYTWRAYANTQRRPLAVVMDKQTFSGTSRATTTIPDSGA